MPTFDETAAGVNIANPLALVLSARHDPRQFRYRRTFALHNLPGIRLGHVALGEGPVSCASRGLRIVLTGKTSHCLGAGG